MVNKGKLLEQLVCSLEKALAQNKNVLVESPKRVPDKITGKKREHDVVLTIKQGHHQMMVAIECRDRSRPITVNQVEGFSKKCEHTGVNQGVIVSSSGFYNTAKEKADFLGIRCLDIEEVESFDWMLASGFHKLTKKLLHSEWMFYPEKDNVASTTNMEIIDAKGNLLTQEHMTSIALTQLNTFLPDIPEPVEKDVITVKFQGGNLIIRNTETKETTPVKFAIAKLHYTITEEIIPFKLVQYKEGDENITNAAIAEFKYGDVTGKFIIVEEKDGQKKVVFVKDNKN